MTRAGFPERGDTDSRTAAGRSGHRKVPRAIREPQMLATAGRVFAARGFHEASMDEIAEGAGTSKPMLYSYFGSKEGLYFAYVNLSYRDLVAAIDAAVQAAGDEPEQQLRAGARAYYAFVGAHRDAFSVLFRETGDPEGMLNEQRRRLRRRVAIPLQRILSADNPAVRHLGGTDALAEATLGAARSLANWWLDHPEISAEAMGDHLMDMILVGVRGLARSDS